MKKTKASGTFGKTLFVLILFVAIAFTYVYISDKIETEKYPLGYENLVNKYSSEYSVPTELVYAVIKVESNFNNLAVSPVGAKGLMQMLPDTFSWLTKKNGESLSDELLFEPEVSIKYGCFYLSILYDMFGEWTLACAAYNAGQGNVKKWIENEELYKNGELVKIPFKETRNYITKVNKAKDKYTELYFCD